MIWILKEKLTKYWDSALDEDGTELNIITIQCIELLDILWTDGYILRL